MKPTFKPYFVKYIKCFVYYINSHKHEHLLYIQCVLKDKKCDQTYSQLQNQNFQNKSSHTFREADIFIQCTSLPFTSIAHI